MTNDIDNSPYPSAPDGLKRPLRSTLLNIENYIGQPVVVHSAPTAWIGYLVDVERREEAVGVTLADAGLWINGELKDVVQPGKQASKDSESSHHHVTYIPIVTALQPAASPAYIKAHKAKYRGRRPGDPANITLENYAKSMGQDVDTCAKALTNAYTAAKGFDSVVSTVSSFADELAFPAPAVASMLLSDVLARTW